MSERVKIKLSRCFSPRWSGGLSARPAATSRCRFSYATYAHLGTECSPPRSPCPSIQVIYHGPTETTGETIKSRRMPSQVAVYLFVEPRVWLDLSHDQTDYRPAVDGGKREESRARRYVLVPLHGVVDWEPILAQRSHLFDHERWDSSVERSSEGTHLLQIVGTQKSELNMAGRAERHWCTGWLVAAHLIRTKPFEHTIISIFGYYRYLSRPVKR